MKKTKVFAAYLPQFHETEDNDRFWGKGFTDWNGVKNAMPQFEGHRQPRVPRNACYYDLSDYNVIAEQAKLAREYGIDGFNIYHYWFKNGKQELQLPSELLLSHEEIDISYFFTWDNCHWKRTWSNIKGNDWGGATGKEERKGPEMLCELDYGKESDWEKHFEYLLSFFRDKRYLKIDGKPVFAFMTYQDADTMRSMIAFWKKKALDSGFPGLFILTNYDHTKGRFKEDCFFAYQPPYSAWSKRMKWESRFERYLGIKGHRDGSVRYLYDYDKVWKKIISFSKKKTDIIPGAFVAYDDTPRRGKNALVIKGDTPEKFEKYFRALFEGCLKNGQELLLLTAWNEWGEGAYLEADEINSYAYLQAVRNVCMRGE